jgi:hypothetical protein
LNGGEHIGYQNRKAAKTTNTLFLSDNQGLPLLFDELCQVLKEAAVDLRGVFMNADSGFAAQTLRVQWKGNRS